MKTLWISLRIPRPLGACPGLQDQLSHYTPRLIQFDPQQLALEVAGSLRLFGGPRRLWRNILRACPPQTRAAMAPTPWGAVLLARNGAAFPSGPHRALRSRTLQRYLDRLPCSVLDAAEQAIDQLDGWGCHTLGALRELPRAGLAQRGLGAVLEQMDRAYGPDTTPYPWLGAPPGFSATRELHYHGTGLAALETALIPLLEALCSRLQAHQAACDQLFITLYHDDTRVTPPTTRLALAFSQPQWRVQTLLPLCRLRLLNTPLPGPVQRITVHCAAWQPRQALVTSLLPDAQIDQQREDRLIDTLRARLGAGSLRFPQPQDWPLPEHAEHWTSTPSHSAGPRSAAPPIHSQDSRPLWLLTPPAPLDTKGNRPCWQGRQLRLVAGPERIEAGWWRGQATRRDYFIAQNAQAVRYWVFHDLDTGGWFLHGCFA